MKKVLKNKTLASIFSFIIVSSTISYSQDFNISVLDSDPNVIGKKVANNVVSRPYGWRYQKVCAYYGALIYANSTNDKEITSKVEDGFAPYHSGKKKYKKGHVDYNVFGIWPLELYHQTGKEDYKNRGIILAEGEYMNPRADGLTNLARYWVDDMYMVASLQVQAFKNTKDSIYLNRAAHLLNNYIDSLQKPNGLFYHRYDAPHYWGRGNGWAAAAMAEVLLVLPQNHKDYNMLHSAYTKMMNGLLLEQGDNGMWHQIIDNHGSFEEPSCTGMFLFAMITGLDLGILADEEFFLAITKGWNALSTFVNEKGEVVDVCMWTNAKKREKYYMRRPRITGDYHGQAAFLWASTAMIRFMTSDNQQIHSQ